MLTREAADEIGHPLAAHLVVRDDVRAFQLHGEVVLTQADVRALQFAKGAISTGIETAMRELGLVAADLDEVLLAGSFGSYINPRSAQVVGLVPAVTVDKIKAVGNTASEGAKMALMSFREREVAWEIPGDRRVHRAVRRGGLQRPVHREPGAAAARLAARPGDAGPAGHAGRRGDAMTSTGARVALIACGAVAQDTAALVQAHGWDADVHGISSDLHMTPLDIAPAVEEKLELLLPRYDRVVVVYGDCGTGGRLDRVLEKYPAVRPAGVHCFEWYAGDVYRRFHDDIGIYFLTDWLVTNWDRAVIRGLGLDRFPWLKETYFGNLTRILFVRQHPDADREAKAREIADYMEKPLEIHDLGITPLDELLTPLMEETGAVRS